MFSWHWILFALEAVIFSPLQVYTLIVVSYIGIAFLFPINCTNTSSAPTIKLVGNTKRHAGLWL